MAAHGTMEINGHPLGWWYARRQEPLASVGDEYTYECAVEINGQRVQFLLRHRYANGLTALAGAVLSAGAALLTSEGG